jgi:hypothetical protein
MNQANRIGLYCFDKNSGIPWYRMTLAYENKCAICGKETIISVEYYNTKEKEQQQKMIVHNELYSSKLVEHINF